MNKEIREYRGGCPVEAANIRNEVFVAEQGFREEFDDTDKRAVHLVMFVDGKDVATCRLFADGDEGRYHLGRVAVRKSLRGSGFGKDVVFAAEDVVRKEGGRLVFVSAQIRAKGFYEAIGYKAKGDVYLEENYPHVYMDKIL